METIRSTQLWITVVPLCLAPLFFGSVDQVWVAVWVILLSIGALCGATLPLSIGQRRVLLAFLALCCAYALVALAQITPRLTDQLDDPIWQWANELLQTGALPRISSRAEIPSQAIGHFLLAVTSFMSGLFVGTSRRNADMLTAAARYSILLYAIYGLIAFTFTPDTLLWAPKRAYFDSLTASFVNHNTAATFVGCGLILWTCSALQAAQSLKFLSLRQLLLTRSNEHVALRFNLHAAASVTCLFALLLTGSRGGLICSSLGLLVAIGLMIANRLRLRLWYGLGFAVVGLAATLIWLGQTGRIGSHGVFDGTRWSVYRYCIDAIRQRPLLGSGAGTFADIFPSLRGPNFNSWGVWDYAHSTILEIAVEMGVPIAATIALAAVASLLVLTQAALSVGSKDQSQASLAAITGITVSSYLHSLIDFSLQIPGYLIVFAILLGCWLARSCAEQIAVASVQSGSLVGVGSKADVRQLARETPPAAGKNIP